MSTQRAIAHMEMMDNTVKQGGVPDPQPYSAFVGTGVHYTPYAHSIVAPGEVQRPTCARIRLVSECIPS